MKQQGKGAGGGGNSFYIRSICICAQLPPSSVPPIFRYRPHLVESVIDEYIEI